MDHLTRAALNPVAGHVIINFSSFLRGNRQYDLVEFARRQYPVLTDFESRTAGTPVLSEFHNYYREWAGELEWFAERSRC